MVACRRFVLKSQGGRERSRSTSSSHDSASAVLVCMILGTPPPPRNLPRVPSHFYTLTDPGLCSGRFPSCSLHPYSSTGGARSRPVSYYELVPIQPHLHEAWFPRALELPCPQLSHDRHSFYGAKKTLFSPSVRITNGDAEGNGRW